ncbi:MAG TPA: GNAT family N-acetyltransferase [Streptosporangiaceae bacterium]|nr:GNAT family N-acetyltransferase [Streptosporangiaceae bacterium]
MRIEQFDPEADEASVRACDAIYRAGAPADDPSAPPMSPRCFAGWLTWGWTEDPLEAWLARDDAGLPSAWYTLALPERENRHTSALALVVHPSRRRAGLGTVLVGHAVDRARHRGRSLLMADTREGSPGSAFARALGAQQTITEVRRVLEVNAALPAKLATLRDTAEQGAQGYSLLSWQGPVDAVWLADVTDLNAAAADMPRGAGRDEQRWDAQRVRLDERRVAAQGLRSYTVAARHTGTGHLAGLTQLAVDPAEPTWGFQELTVVARLHRGHHLGLLVKVAMLEMLAGREPQLNRVMTGNADQNQHMIAINAALGFRVLDRWPSWELPSTGVPRHQA